MEINSWSPLALAKISVLLVLSPGIYGNQLQQPLQNNVQKHINNPKTSVVQHDQPKNSDAELTLYHDPKWPCSPKRNGLKANIKIPVDTCASANFTMKDNVYLGKPGYCGEKGKSAYISIYESADCTGHAKHPDWYDRGYSAWNGHCLSSKFWGSKTKEDQWSIMFHCTDDKKATEATKHMNISIPQPAPVVKKPEPPRPKFASVSDSACFIDELGTAGFPRFIFQKPHADKCVNVAPLHKLKIYRTALCPDGTDATFVKWRGKGCRGDPQSKQVVEKGLTDTCLEMGGKDAGSYTFWCSGDLTQGNVAQSLFENDSKDAVRIHYSNAPSRGRTRARTSAASALGSPALFLYGGLTCLAALL